MWDISGFILNISFWSSGNEAAFIEGSSKFRKIMSLARTRGKMLCHLIEDGGLTAPPDPYYVLYVGSAEAFDDVFCDFPPGACEGGREASFVPTRGSMSGWIDRA